MTFGDLSSAFLSWALVEDVRSKRQAVIGIALVHLTAKHLFDCCIVPRAENLSLDSILLTQGILQEGRIERKDAIRFSFESAHE